jgi:hypothetical protein
MTYIYSEYVGRIIIGSEHFLTLYLDFLLLTFRGETTRGERVEQVIGAKRPGTKTTQWPKENVFLDGLSGTPRLKSKEFSKSEKK